MFRRHPVVLWWTFLALLNGIANAQLGDVQTDVKWRAGHAAGKMIVSSNNFNGEKVFSF